MTLKTPRSVTWAEDNNRRERSQTSTVGLGTGVQGWRSARAPAWPELATAAPSNLPTSTAYLVTLAQAST